MPAANRSIKKVERTVIWIGSMIESTPESDSNGKGKRASMVLEIRRLEKIIEGHSALAIDALDIQAGEVVAVIGPVKSGKSLLVRLISGIIPASGGSILMDGVELTHLKAQGEQIGVLFEEDLLYERQTPRENLRFYCRLFGVPDERVDRALAQVGLSDQAQKPVAKLNSSSQRRLAFARILLLSHRLVQQDQPTLRSDMETQGLFTRLIQQMAANGTAVLLTDEDLTWASRCCTRVIELENGRITNSYALENVSAPGRLTPFKVPARKEDRILLYDPGDILFACSRDNKTYLRTAAEEAVTNLTLQELEERLQGRGFFKSHRAYLVNLQHVKAVIQFTRNSYNLQLDDPQQTLIPLSKQFEKELQTLLGY